MNIVDDVVQPLYNQTLRPHLPRKYGVLNGVTARSLRLLDLTDHRPDYEAACIDALREYIRSGDSVLIVGGGAGVSAVHASRAAGLDGDVTVYEASPDVARICRETIALNDTAAPVDVTAAAVGETHNLYGDPPAHHIQPSELPSAAVTELDCEGAETDIIPALTPQTHPIVVCESHGCYGAPTQDVYRAFRDQGYDVQRRAWQNVARDVSVLLALPEAVA